MTFSHGGRARVRSPLDPCSRLGDLRHDRLKLPAEPFRKAVEVGFGAAEPVAPLPEQVVGPSDGGLGGVGCGPRPQHRQIMRQQLDALGDADGAGVHRVGAAQSKRLDLGETGPRCVGREDRIRGHVRPRADRAGRRRMAQADMSGQANHGGQNHQADGKAKSEPDSPRPDAPDDL